MNTQLPVINTLFCAEVQEQLAKNPIKAKIAEELIDHEARIQRLEAIRLKYAKRAQELGL